MSFLEVKGLTKNFGGLTAVNKLNFEVKEGEIFGLIGPNGAGKSTVFSLITSYLKPSSGDIIFQDQNITNFNTHEIAAIGIVRTFQQNNLFMDMTVQQNVVVAHHLLCTAGKWSQFLNSKQARIDEERFQESAMKILDDLGLVKFKNAKARNLSHGHKRVLGIATGIALKPMLFLFDEAFSGMYPK
jgi:branched-chain amino acid transport system ATP-binding protein